MLSEVHECIYNCQIIVIFAISQYNLWKINIDEYTNKIVQEKLREFIMTANKYFYTDNQGKLIFSEWKKRKKKK